MCTWTAYKNEKKNETKNGVVHMQSCTSVIVKWYARLLYNALEYVYSTQSSAKKFWEVFNVNMNTPFCTWPWYKLVISLRVGLYVIYT